MISLLGACGDSGEGAGAERGAKFITSSDGALQLQVPSSWSKSELNPVAAVQAGDEEQEAYGMVIEDPRKPLHEYTLERFADIQMQKLVTRVALASLAGPTEVQVDGKTALQYQLRGLFNETEVVYLYTFVETEDRFLKVVTWSLGSKFDDNKEDLEQVSASVKELKPLAEPTPAATNSDPAVAPTQQGPGAFDRDPDA